MRLRLATLILALGFSAATQTHATMPLSTEQPPAGAQLEGATFKPYVSETPGVIAMQTTEMDPSHLRMTGLSINNLLTLAYGLERYQLEAPDWTNSVRFNVEATFSGANDTKNLAMLLQPAIVEQFKLTYHTEGRTMKAYDLVVAPGEIKMKPSDKPLSNPTSTGSFGYRMNAVMPMSFLAEIIGGQVGLPVLDKTNLTGNYEFNLTFVPDSMQMQPNPPEGPSLKDALRDELGLALQPGTASVPVMIVDHIERAPAGNN